MIKNQKQAGITKSKLSELKTAKEKLHLEKEKYSALEFELADNSLNSLISELENQIHIYNALVKNDFHVLKPKNLEDIPRILIAARISQNLSQADLAEILGINEQQVQRYEATDFESASWTRIVEFSFALNLQIDFESVLIYNEKNIEVNFGIPESSSKEKIRLLEEK